MTALTRDPAGGFPVVLTKVALNDLRATGSGRREGKTLAHPATLALGARDWRPC